MPVTNNTLTLKFYNSAIDNFLNFAVIITKYKDKWVFCKHKDRTTYEIPGGKREAGEAIIDTAKRELYEETGATVFDIKPVTPYSVIEKGIENFGMVYFADIQVFEELPNSEIKSIHLLEGLPSKENLTYPSLHPLIFEKGISMYKEGKL